MIDTQKYIEETNHPGKFEHCKPATVYFWELALNGEGGDELIFEDGEIMNIFKVREDERVAFGLSQPYYAISENNNGFAVGVEMTAQHRDEVIEEFQQQEGMEDEDDGY